MDTIMTKSQSFMNTTLSQPFMETVTHHPVMRSVSWNTFFLLMGVTALSFYTLFIVLQCMDSVMMCCARNEHEKSITVKRKRRTISDMPHVFSDGQLIRHTITKTWVGHYDAEHNGIVYNDEFYSSLGHFTSQHYKSDGEKTIRRDE